MASKDIRTNIDVTADTSDATSNLGDVERAAKDAEDAAKELSKTDVHLDTADAVDDLGKIDSAAGDTETALKGIADTPIDVDESAALAGLDRIEAQLKEITDTPVDIDAAPAVAGLDKVRDSGDQTGSVLANMVGNTTQDLAGLGGVAGTVGGALGQIGEYATEGNISLANLGKLAGPMAGVAVAGLAISTVVGRMQKNAKEAKEEFEALVKIQKDLAAGEIRAAAEGLNAQYADLTTKAKGFGLSVVDVADAIVGSGASIEDLDGRIARLAVQYEEANTKATMYADGGAEELAAKLYDQIAALSDVRDELEQARGSYANADQDAVDAAEGTAAYEAALRKVGPAAENAGGRIRDFSADTIEAKEAAEDATTEVEKFDAKLRLLLGGIDDEQAWLDLKDNITDLTTKMYEAGAGTDDHRQAVLDLKEEMLKYVGALEGVPVEKKTEIVALIDQEAWEDAELALQKLEKSRYPVYTPVLRSGGIAGLPPGVGIGASSVVPSAPVATPLAPMTVTVNMPAGSRGVDVVRQISGQARRSGRRYGVPVVHYARGRQFPGGGPH